MLHELVLARQVADEAQEVQPAARSSWRRSCGRGAGAGGGRSVAATARCPAPAPARRAGWPGGCARRAGTPARPGPRRGSRSRCVRERRVVRGPGASTSGAPLRQRPTILRRQPLPAPGSVGRPARGCARGTPRNAVDVLAQLPHDQVACRCGPGPRPRTPPGSGGSSRSRVRHGVEQRALGRAGRRRSGSRARTRRSGTVRPPGSRRQPVQARLRQPVPEPEGLAVAQRVRRQVRRTTSSAAGGRASSASRRSASVCAVAA